MSQECSLIMTLSKILNLPPRSCPYYSLTIYSLLTSIPIIDKQLKGRQVHQQIVFNYALKIAYVLEEKEIVVRMVPQDIYADPQPVEFVVDLEELRTKGIIFCQMGARQSVLKITGQPPDMVKQSRMRPTSRSSQSHHSRHKTLDLNPVVRQKQPILGHSHTNTSQTLNQRSHSRKAFSQRAKDLLGQVQQLKRRIKESRCRPEPSNPTPVTTQRSIEDEFNDYYGQERESPTSTARSNPFLPGGLGLVSGRGSLLEGRSRGGDDSRRSSASQRRRLVLNNLKVENCYDDGGGHSRNRRRWEREL